MKYQRLDLPWIVELDNLSERGLRRPWKKSLRAGYCGLVNRMTRTYLRLRSFPQQSRMAMSYFWISRGQGSESERKRVFE